MQERPATMLTRDEFLAAPIGQLDGYYLRTRCTGCTQIAVIPFALIVAKARRRGRCIEHQRLAELIPKLKCSHCGSRPAQLEAVDCNDIGWLGAPERCVVLMP